MFLSVFVTGLYRFVIGCITGECPPRNKCNCPYMLDPICCYVDEDREYDFASPCDAECALDIEDAENHKNCYLGKCTLQPTTDPTGSPTIDPTVRPSKNPTPSPTDKPTPSPTYKICHCAIHHEPVCCEGRTYDNACLAECHLHVDDADLECVEGMVYIDCVCG